MCFFRASSFRFQSDVSSSFLRPPAMRAHCAHVICRCAVNLIGHCCTCCRVTAEGSCHYRWESFSPEFHGNSVNKLQSGDREFNRAVAVWPLTCFNPVLVSPPSAPDYRVVGWRRSASCVASGRISFGLSIDTVSHCEFSWPLVDLVVPHPPTALCGMSNVEVWCTSISHVHFLWPHVPKYMQITKYNSYANSLLSHIMFCMDPRDGIVCGIPATEGKRRYQWVPAFKDRGKSTRAMNL